MFLSLWMPAPRFRTVGGCLRLQRAGARGRHRERPTLVLRQPLREKLPARAIIPETCAKCTLLALEGNSASIRWFSALRVVRFEFTAVV